MTRSMTSRVRRRRIEGLCDAPLDVLDCFRDSPVDLRLGGEAGDPWTAQKPKGKAHS